MSCVYTGARVLFEEYNLLVNADLYAVGDAIIVRWNTDSALFHQPDAQQLATHVVRIGRNGWHRTDLGVTVTEAGNVTGELHT